MSATEKLCCLLDERGVEWWPLGSNMTECVVDDVRIKYRQVGRGLIVSTCTEGTVKPEQAIAATLGRGECHDDSGAAPLFFSCSECGCCHLRNVAYVDMPNFCPKCGRKVVDG